MTSEILLIALIYILQLIFNCPNPFLFDCASQKFTSYSSTRISGHLFSTVIASVSVHKLFYSEDALIQRHLLI